MYTQTWNKYLPIIKILLKRSVNSPQTLNLNVGDFEKLGSTRKSGYKFSILFSNGRVDNVISSSQMAKELSVVLLEDKMVKDLFTQNDYKIDMNAKFQLSIQYTSKASQTESAMVGELAGQETH